MGHNAVVVGGRCRAFVRNARAFGPGGQWTWGLSGYEKLGPKVESWEGESVGEQSSHPEKDH